MLFDGITFENEKGFLFKDQAGELLEDLRRDVIVMYYFLKTS